MPTSFTKTQQLLVYITKNCPNVSVTSLMKLSYLIDLISIQNTDHQITDFKYKRYNFGPFDSKIYENVDFLTKANIILSKSDYSAVGAEYIVYYFNNDKEFCFDDLNEEEIKTADEVVDSLRGYGAKVLTELAYKTKPMQKYQATLGGNEHMNEDLDMKAE